MRKTQATEVPAAVTPDRFVTRREAAELIGFKPAHLANLALRGDGPPYHKHGRGKRGRVLYSLAELMAWVRSLPRHGGGTAA